MPEYRLDELSALSGVSIRNIRAYRERGLLDPPRRQGRSAFYDDRHLSQLRTINELLRKGFTSAHIAEFLSSARAGHDLADILGLQRAIFGPPRDAAAVGVPIDIDIDLDGDEAKRLLRYGLGKIVDGRLTLLDPNIAEIVRSAGEQLRYVRAILRVADGITGQLDQLAKSVVEALEEGLVADAGVAEFRRLVDDYQSLGQRIVADQFEDALQRHLVTAVSGLPTDFAG